MSECRNRLTQRASRTASYRLVPLGIAWYRINFFLRAKLGKKIGFANCGRGFRERYRWWCVSIERVDEDDDEKNIRPEVGIGGSLSGIKWE
jgi:hypothetical protein